MAGDYGKIKTKVQYVDDELPDSMLTAIKIIERLLTQTKYHHQHVAYKNYPPMNLEEHEEEEEDDKKKGGFGISLGVGKKEDKKEEEEKKDEEEHKDGKISLEHLFTFECRETTGKPNEDIDAKQIENFDPKMNRARMVSSIDINVQNPDLIVVGYGEYDINCTDDK